MTQISKPRRVFYTSGGTLVNEVLYPYPCSVIAIHVAHSGGAAHWVQIHDSDTVPAEGTVPIVTHAVDANGDAHIEGDMFPMYFENGVYVCESDTVPTKTLSAGADLFITLCIEEHTAV